MGKYGRVWEGMGIIAAPSNIMCGRLSDWSDWSDWSGGHCRLPGAIVCVGGWLVLRSLYFMLNLMDLFANICQIELFGRIRHLMQHSKT